MRERRLNINPFPRKGVIFLRKIKEILVGLHEKGRQRMSLEPNRKNQTSDVLVLNQNENNSVNDDETEEIVIVIRGGNIIKFEHRKCNVS
jgi:hypothetical protein